ncbi:protein CELLULOSE SYNTHASE INTERACTIVE 3-like [Phalaenopsis equestris]|uniref:protein CELLULOSE SYNTHASE INTERACTIVE 3-like n=1 Tax=Phalaenopsis equestris TaxID=78828 RepID=UPI0009E3CD1F|nr:protein CELLULOSE SYNTHASE INTERACTIVE 3-like [Phalaenopsis equestris]
MIALSLRFPVSTKCYAWSLVAIFSAVLLLFFRLREIELNRAPSSSGDPCSSSEEISRDLLRCAVHTMTDEPDLAPADHWLSQARLLVPTALHRAQSASRFPGRWKTIISKIEQLPSCLSNLSSHPFFSKNSLFREQLQSVCSSLEETILLAENSSAIVGKLQMQSHLDSLSAKLDLNLRDCNQLIKTGVLGNSTAQSGQTETARFRIQELLARLQIGHAEAKHRAIEGLVEAITEDEKSVLLVLCRSNISSLVQLLTATAVRTREKAATVVCMLAESGSCDNSLVSEGALPPLIRLVESGTPRCREKALMALERLSMSPDTARSIVGHGGIGSLVEACHAGDSIVQSAAAATLKNLSAVPEVRQSLADEGVIKLMIHLLDCGIMLGSKEHAAECLQKLTSSNESLRKAVVSEGGIRSLLAYIDGPLPQESAVGALQNLIASVSISADSLVSISLLPRLVHVLKEGSLGAQQAAACTICRISNSTEVKKMVGEFGCVPLLLKLMEAKTNGAREAATQAVANLISYPHNCREVKKEEKSVPNLVQLLDPSSENTAKKYAVSCLLQLSSSKKCKKLMCSYGAIGYLKKLSEMDVTGAKKLLERLEKGKLRSFFSREEVAAEKGKLRSFFSRNLVFPLCFIFYMKPNMRCMMFLTSDDFVHIQEVEAEEHVGARDNLTGHPSRQPPTGWPSWPAFTNHMEKHPVGHLSWPITLAGHWANHSEERWSTTYRLQDTRPVTNDYMGRPLTSMRPAGKLRRVRMKDFGEASCSSSALNVDSRGRSYDRNLNRGRSKSKFGQQTICWNCGKAGHIKMNCKNSKKNENDDANVVSEEI